MLFQHSLAFLGKLCIYQEGKRGGRERGGARHSAVFAAGSKMPLCLVCRQLWFSYIFMGIPLPLLPFESPGAYIDSQDTGLGGGLQGIEGFQGWRMIHLLAAPAAEHPEPRSGSSILCIPRSFPAFLLGKTSTIQKT